MNVNYGVGKNVNLIPGQFVRVTLSTGRQWTGTFVRIVDERGLKIAEFQTTAGTKRLRLGIPFYMRVMK